MRVRLAEVLVGGRRRRRSLGGWVGLVLAWWGKGRDFVQGAVKLPVGGHCGLCKVRGIVVDWRDV